MKLHTHTNPNLRTTRCTTMSLMFNMIQYLILREEMNHFPRNAKCKSHLFGLRQQVIQVVPSLVVEIEVLALRLALGAHHFRNGRPVPAVLHQPCERKETLYDPSVKTFQCETNLLILNEVTLRQIDCFAFLSAFPLKACTGVIYHLGQNTATILLSTSETSWTLFTQKRNR